MICFLHTGDWQLGMTRHFLLEGAQERYSQARVDAIRTMGRIAKEESCQFMLVCGDAFESNQVDRKTVARALEALKEVPVPVFILPGNHDPLNAASVYRSSTFIERRPGHIHVIESAAPLKVADGVELVGAPWMSKRPVANPIHEALNALTPATGITRICLGLLIRLRLTLKPPGSWRLLRSNVQLTKGRFTSWRSEIAIPSPRWAPANGFGTRERPSQRISPKRGPGVPLSWRLMTVVR